MRWPVPRAALLAVALVVAGEAGLHLGSRWLPEPVLWGQGETSTKVALAQRASVAAPIDVLILGPSHASLGVSPAAMRAVPGCGDWTVFNGALNGRDYPVLDFVTEHVYLDALRPRVAVISVSPIGFNAHAVLWANNTKEFMAAPKPLALRTTGVESWWRHLLADHVNLYRFRRRAHGLRDGRVGGEPTLELDGFHPVDGSFDQAARARLNAGHHAYRAIWRGQRSRPDGSPAGYAFGGPALEAFERLVTRLQQRGVTVVVFNMPFRPELLALPGDGAAGYATYLEGMAALRDRYHFQWLDYEATLTLTDADFKDVDHLNRQGAVRLSQQLAVDLKAAGVVGP